MKFETLVNRIFSFLPADDYPVLNSRKFLAIWLEFALDRSVTSMRDLFGRLKVDGGAPDISTFSKANSSRDVKRTRNIYYYLKELASKKRTISRYKIVPFDATVISLTSKLLWSQGYHQVKLYTGKSVDDNILAKEIIIFGQSHDYNYGFELIDELEEGEVGVMDRGFAGVKFVNHCCQSHKTFMVRMKNNCKLILDEERGYCRWDRKDVDKDCRIVNFCDLETKTEFRLATNLPLEGAGRVSNEEIGDIYRQRWDIELFWKFLKMHLKLDKLISKSVNGIQIQIYMSLIAYLILQLIDIPECFGCKIIDKLRYLQAMMCRQGNYVRWIESIIFC
jgi:putative transposase